MTHRTRVAFCERPPDLVARAARSVLSRFDLRIPDSDEPAAIRSALRGADALLARKRRVGGRELDQSAAKLIVMLGRHPVSVALEEAAARGAPVVAVPHPGAIAVADHTLALLLAVTRRIVEGDRGVREGGYRSRGLSPSRTTEESFAFNWLGRDDIVALEGRTLGLAGFGAIGQEVARRARGFGMKVSMFQRRPLREPWPGRFGVRQRGSFGELLETSDIVSLHLPHTEATENLLDGAALDRMKRGAILVNTARGGLVDEAALAERLRDGRLGGAGLDVFREEPLPEAHPLAQAPGAVLAPHTGGAGAGGARELFARVGEAVDAFFAGRAGPRRESSGGDGT